MRRLVLLIGLCAVPFAPLADGAGAQHDRKPQGSVWVVNRDKGEVTVFDAIERRSPRADPDRLRGARGRPLAAVTRMAYVTNEFEDTVSVISTRDARAAQDPAVGPSPASRRASRRRELDARRTRRHERASPRSTTATGLVRRSTASSANPSRPGALRLSVASLADTIYVPHETGDEVTGINAETGAIEFSVRPGSCRRARCSRTTANGCYT